MSRPEEPKKKYLRRHIPYQRCPRCSSGTKIQGNTDRRGYLSWWHCRGCGYAWQDKPVIDIRADDDCISFSVAADQLVRLCPTSARQLCDELERVLASKPCP